MDCKAIEKKLIFYLEGEITDEESKIISNHLEVCNLCAAKIQYLKESFQVIETEKSTEVKPFLYTRIQSRMLPKENTVRRWILAPMAIASVLTIGVIVGTMVGKMTINQSNSSAQIERDVAYLFNDAGIESVEIRLLID